MHNSLHLRDLLRRTNNDPLRIGRRDPHRLIAPDPASKPGPGDFELTGRWPVGSYPDAARRLITGDLRDFLARMGIETDQASERSEPPRIALAAAPDLSERDCRLTLQPGRVAIEGGGAAGLWAGHAWLEWEMRARRGPYLPAGVFTRRAAWPIQISQGPWGGNYSVPDFAPEYLSDDAFRLYAHFGVNTMMIYGDLLCYVQSAILPELNTPGFDDNLTLLQDASRRAADYGVRFSYVAVGPKLRPDHLVFANHPGARGTGARINGARLHFLCSSDEAVLAFYQETFERLFREVPGLAGTVLIVAEESFYNCKMWRAHASDPCPRCSNLGTEPAIAGVVGAVAEAVHRARPGAYVAAWPYTTDQWERPDRAEFIRQLPADAAFWLAIEKDQRYDKGRYVKHIWDYSIDFTGPSDVMRLDARVARETGHGLFVKTETGIGLEVFQFPYVPAMQRLQQSWLFFGMFGSRAEELGLWAAYRPDLSRDAFLHAMAARDFGPETTDAVLAAWKHMSEAMGHLPCVCLTTYYVGPSFLGPCHPLVPQAGDAIPDVFHGYLFYLQENEETFSHRQIDEARTCLVMDRLPDTARAVGMNWRGESDGWEIAVDEYAAAAAEAQTAWELLVQAQPSARTEADRARLGEETLLVELVYRTLRSCENTLRFLLARREWERTGDHAAREEMRRIALMERRNASGAEHIYRRAPWLDLAERSDGVFSPCADMIAAKVAWIDALYV